METEADKGKGKHKGGSNNSGKRGKGYKGKHGYGGKGGKQDKHVRGYWQYTST